jgi:amino acid adenylation domain-containing protein
MFEKMDLEQRIAQLSPAKLALLQRKLQKKNTSKKQPTSRSGYALRQDYVPLSFAQERLWFLEQMQPDSCIYNLPALIPLPGPIISSDLVEDALRRIVARHSALRTRFVIKDENPCQVIENDARKALDFSTVDLRARKASPRPLSQLLDEEIWVPFNLANGPLLRARLFLQGGNENFLLLVMHHIVSDGWSINIFTKEFLSFYEAARSGKLLDSPPVPLQYADYAVAQRRMLEGANLNSLISYWRSRMEGAPSLLAMPLDRPRPAVQTFKGALHPFGLPRFALRGMKALCRKCGVVPFMVLLAAFKVLLFRYTHQSKIVVGTPIANRNRSEHEAVIGLFANTLALCSSISPEMSFYDLIAQVRETTLGAYEHQDLPFEKLVSELQPERSLSYNPLFQVMFILQNLPAEKPNIEQIVPPSNRASEPLALEVRLSKFDLTLALTETEDGFSAALEYATDLFDPATIERMATHFVRILAHILKHPDEQLAGFSFLSANERRLILEEWNDTARTWSEIFPLHGRFERWARNVPDATAVIFRQSALSYEELDRRANIVARLLRRQRVDRGSIIGICLPRSLEMVVGLFAILKAGGAYMPIDPDFPEERIGYMLADAGATHVLTTAGCLPSLSAFPVNAIALDELAFGDDDECDDEVRAIAVDPGDVAYIIFTSGSTGQPKGVMVSHGAIYNRLQWMQEAYGLTSSDRVMQKTPFTFDVSVWEFFWPLSEGACLVIAEPDRHKESAYLVDLIKAQRISCMHFVPSMLQLFLNEDLAGCDSLKRIICSGEALTIEQCRRLQALPGVKTYNLYGPTEAAVDVTHWDCDEWHDQYISVPIGRPIANTQIYILNEQLQPMPIGVAGELFIGGHNLAEGYLNKPELTKKQFIASPFTESAGVRLYKTGDLARFRTDGAIEYIGRIDSQVKLRGVRIELGEIECVLSQYPDVAEAVVVVCHLDDQDDRLVAYIVPERPDEFLDTASIRAFMGKKLPNYMVPSAIITVPRLPLSENGKLDRKSLPAPKPIRVGGSNESVSDIERELLGIWQRYLKVDALGTSDDFFAMGGHSILATQMINAVSGHYDLKVPVRLLFENPTVNGLAKALSEFEDPAWLNDSDAASAISRRSRLRLLQTLDERSEEELEGFLRQQLEEHNLMGFEDVASLLAWSQTVALDESNDAARNAANLPSTNSSSEPVNAEYMFSYFQLARTRMEIENIYFRGYSALSGGQAQVSSGHLLAALQAQGKQIFETYARTIKQRLSQSPGAAISPSDLVNCCMQMINIAGLTAPIKPL